MVILEILLAGAAILAGAYAALRSDLQVAAFGLVLLAIAVIIPLLSKT